MRRTLTGIVLAAGLAIGVPSAVAGPVPPVDYGAACDAAIGSGEHDIFTPFGILQVWTCNAAGAPQCTWKTEDVNVGPVLTTYVTLCEPQTPPVG